MIEQQPQVAVRAFLMGKIKLEGNFDSLLGPDTDLMKRAEEQGLDPAWYRVREIDDLIDETDPRGLAELDMKDGRPGR